MKKIYGYLLGINFIFENLSREVFQKSLEKYSSSIPEFTAKQKLKHTKTFYQNPFFNQNKFYYNKGISRSGKKTRGKYISMQVKARSRRKKIRKTLEGKI